MPLDIRAIQKSLAIDSVDGWLLYDFHGSNPIAVSLAGLIGRHTTRRWFYFIPASGRPQKLVHAIEPATLDGLQGDKTIYAGRRQLEQGVTEILKGTKVVAMEYSNECAIPYISRVDAGTVDFIRRLGVRVASSGDLVGRFEAAWTPDQIATHLAASEKLHEIKDRAFAYASAKLSAGETPLEFEIQQKMMEWFRELGLVTDHPPIVGSMENAGNPHYAPPATGSRALKPNEILLLDLWGKLDQPGAVYADITWTGFGGTPPPEIAKAWGAITAGRDAAVSRVQKGIAAGKPVLGFEVDRATRDVITAAGYGEYFIHRTGHSLGEEVHGNGVHMDDYETHDDRQLVTGTGFTIEPGVYMKSFGMRTEINMVVYENKAEVSGPVQQTLVKIATKS